MEEEKNNTQEEKKNVRSCPYCKSPYETKVGLNNWKNLFRKPTMDDWITLFILILLIVASYAYVQETKQSRYMITHLDETCSQYDTWKLNITRDPSSNILMPNINLSIPTISPSSNISISNSTETENSSIILGGEKINNSYSN